jgi:hypothetical protein
MSKRNQYQRLVGLGGLQFTEGLRRRLDQASFTGLEHSDCACCRPVPHRRPTRRAVLACCLMVGSWSFNLCADEVAELSARFQREYPEAARRLEAADKNFSAYGRCEFKLLNGKVYVTNKLVVSALDSRRLIIRDDRSVKGIANSYMSEVFCSTPTYAFSLARNSPKSPYIISNYDANIRPDRDVERFYRDYILGASMFLGNRLIDRLRLRTFKVAGIKRVQGGSDSLIELKYACSELFETGTLALDPSSDWVLRSVDVFVDKEKDEHFSRLNYKSNLRYDGSNDVRIPSHTDYVIVLAKNQKTQSNVVDFDEIRVNNTSESVFRLSAYGLPDVPLNSARTYGSFFTVFNPLFWISVAGMAISFVGLRMLRNRESRALN